MRIPKSYPHNFAGIIAAIQDLESAQDLPPVHPGPKPPGIEIDINGDIIVNFPPENGDLWFDTRQGRLFIAIDDDWYQTNGADGLAYMRPLNDPPDPTRLVPGQFWFVLDSNELFVFDGDRWFPVNGGGGNAELQTTATLPLAGTGPRADVASGVSQYQTITPPQLDNFNTQQDYNVWAFKALLDLDAEVTALEGVEMGTVPPAMPAPGQLWYDTNSLEMSVWYEDSDSSQWVPVTASHSYDAELDVITASVELERLTREGAIREVERQALANKDALDLQLYNLTQTVSTVASKVGDYIKQEDIQDFIKQGAVTSATTDLREELTQDINDVLSRIPSIEGLATEESVSALEVELKGLLDNTVDSQDVVAYVENNVETAKDSILGELDAKLENLSTGYLTHTGGTLTGGLKINKVSMDTASLDFSSNSASSIEALRLTTYGDNGNTVTFGSTYKPNELAWVFGADEDFSWIHNNDTKVFSITKEGPASPTILLGDIDADTSNGRVIHNKIDVRERLNKYQSVLEDLRQKVNDADDFDSLKLNIITALATI